MSYVLRVSSYFFLLVAFCVAGDNLNGQVVYSITGFANSFGDPTDPGLSTEVEAGESYVANFLIDDSAVDLDPATTNGLYAGAILSSSIVFSGGYESLVDFAGGQVIIQQDNGGGGVFLSDLNGLGTILVADVGNPFPSDALLTDLGTQIVGSPTSLWSLSDPSGNISSISTGPDLGFGTPTGPIVFSVTSASAVPEPSSACLLGLGMLTCVLRRRR